MLKSGDKVRLIFPEHPKCEHDGVVLADGSIKWDDEVTTLPQFVASLLKTDRIRVVK